MTDHTPPSGRRQTARLRGSGAVAQDDATAIGQRGVQAQGEVQGSIINTGTLIVRQYLAAGASDWDAEQLADQVTQYLQWLRERTEVIELRGIDRGGAKVVQLPLETAYVPLRARPQATPDEAGALGSDADLGVGGKRRRTGSAGLRPDDEETDREVSLDELLALGPRLVVIGGPGSGKTTVLLHMAWALAESLLTDDAEPARTRLGLKDPVAALPLPLFVPLASFARYRRSLPQNTPPQQRTLRHFITHYLISQQAGVRLPTDFFERLLDQGRGLLLLLDGLDEVANEAERHSVRQQVETLVHGKDGLRTVVTCRTVAYRQGRTALGAAFREVQVQPLDFEAHIEPMVRQAYACIHRRDTALRDKRAGSLLDGIRRLEAGRQRRGVEFDPLVGSPLMVRLLLIVHENQRQLPDQRAELFDKATEALLQVDYGHDDEDIAELKAGWEHMLDIAQLLAWHLHGQGEAQGREIEETELRRLLKQDVELAPRADAFIAQARQRGSLVEERDGAYRFIHLALQEFLVARHLREVVAGRDGLQTLVDALAGKLTDPWWREPILLALGYRANRTAPTVRALLVRLRDAGAGDLDQGLAAAELAGTAAADWPDSGAALREACAQRLLGLLGDHEIRLTTPAGLRARAGDALSRLGDPRFDPLRLYLPVGESLGFVHIAADQSFQIGTRRRDADRIARAGGPVFSDEFNEERTPSPEFWIAKYPVTVAQFRAYVEATGFEPGDAVALRDLDSRPVRRVSWREAARYCAWLQDQLTGATWLAGHPLGRQLREARWQVDLPSELEWEKAARGGAEGQLFPWGDEPDPQRGNVWDCGIGDSSAVGCFAPNAFGLFEMAGNLLERTRSPWVDRYGPEMLCAELPKPTRKDQMVARGGSWSSHVFSSRCAYRVAIQPHDRDFNLGFRVVLRSPVALRLPARRKP